MIGLPTETYEDLDGIIDLANKIVENIKTHQNAREQIKSNNKHIFFVPKALLHFNGNHNSQ